MGKICLTYLVLTAFTSLVSCEVPEYVRGFPVGRDPATRYRRNIQRTFSCIGKFGPKCNGCQNLALCADSLINEQTCESLNPARPYCQNDACTAERPLTGCTETSEFTCTGTGQFPNPNDCTSYVICLEEGGNAFPYKCPANYVYDSKTDWCKVKRTASDCRAISCKNQANRFQVYAADKSILAYCFETVQKSETILFRCKDYLNEEYDLDTLKCRFICKSDGRHPVLDDRTSYHQCYRSGNSWQSEIVKCPAGYEFNVDSEKCTIIRATNMIITMPAKTTMTTSPTLTTTPTTPTIAMMPTMTTVTTTTSSPTITTTPTMDITNTSSYSSMPDV